MGSIPEEMILQEMISENDLGALPAVPILFVIPSPSEASGRGIRN